MQRRRNGHGRLAVEAVIAGWVAGYSMAILTTIALTLVAVRGNGLAGFRTLIPEGVSPVLVAVPVSIGAFVVWTLAGLGLATFYELADLGDQSDALGSPSAPFLIIAAALAVIPLPLMVLLWRRNWWIWCSMSAAFLGLFGWAMPLLAER